MRSILLATTLLLASLGCTSGVIGEAGSSDDGHTPELTVAGDALKARFERRDDGFYTSPVLVLDEPATRVAAMWTARALDHEIALEARSIDEDGEPGPWRALAVSFREEELGVARVELDTEATRVQLRVREEDADQLALLTWTGARPELADDAGDFAQSELGLAPELAQAGILPRSAWGARAARCGSADRAKVRLAVHHSVTGRTVGGTFEAALRQIQAFHMDGRGYCDVGYHFFVTADGRVWEARNVDHVGGHSGNYNGGNIGMVFVGCFDQSGACNGLGGTDVPDVMMAGAARAIATLAARHGFPIDGDRIKGHGEQPFQQTACPG
ncbi:N-acetylmuramoyl-L-alanine amidase, partial [Myxococcota bacterium]|nr:N-acetylmuramoyl-L-alanine amidase [Myxococcota bacterium]